MGQKVNPISFRSNQIFNLQENKWFSKLNNNKYGYLLHQDFEIQKFLTNFLNGKKNYIHKIKINRISNTIIINVYLYSKNSKKKYEAPRHYRR